MNLNKLNDKNLHEQTKLAAKKEKLATVELLQHLVEINKRVLYADFGHSTLQKYIVKELGFSEGESFIRVQAMRLIRTSTFAKENIEQGTLSLSNAAALQQYLADNPTDDSKKIDATVNLGVNKTTRDLKAELEKKSGKEIVDKRVTLRKNILDKIKRLNILLDTEMTELEMYETLLDEKIRNHELKTEAKPHAHEKRRVILNVHTRYIPVQVKRAVVAHANHQCEFKNTEGKRCQERRHLQYDHIKPFSLGGNRSEENIQLLCWAHNQRRRLTTFGNSIGAKNTKTI